MPKHETKGRRGRWTTRAACVLLAAVPACGGSSGDETAWEQTVSAEVVAVPFEEQVCGSSFRTIELDHIVELVDPDNMFDANGSGVAIGDLDGDGRADVVLGGLDGPVRVFWNRAGADGAIEFEPSEIGSVRSRSVQLVDVDGDGDLDVTVGPGLEAPVVFLNDGGTFTRSDLPGVTSPAYSMAWIDADGDLDLDLVTAAYDMEFGEIVAREFVNDREEGVWFHVNEAGAYESEQLAPTSHALALVTVDLDGDNSLDLVVGNDFGLADAVWRWDDGWEPANDLFSITTANTMSFDLGDVDRDGDDDLYATDMAPYDDSNAEFWTFMADAIDDPPGPQTVRNVLLDLGADGRPDSAEAMGVHATGWSWAGRMVDVDNDADLDLYVANGMLPSPLLPGEAGTELVETNLAYRNDGAGNFEPADDWGLAVTASTRGLALGDLDLDGDVDIVASTVGSPARVLLNDVCGGASVAIEPRWVGGPTPGTVVRIRESADQVAQQRTLRTGAGYLSSDEPVASFGVGDADSVTAEIVWPDGETTILDEVEAGHRVTVTRG